MTWDDQSHTLKRLQVQLDELRDEVLKEPSHRFLQEAQSTNDPSEHSHSDRHRRDLLASAPGHHRSQAHPLFLAPTHASSVSAAGSVQHEDPFSTVTILAVVVVAIHVLFCVAACGYWCMAL